jgi:voltage-gated sodium channel
MFTYTEEIAEKVDHFFESKRVHVGILLLVVINAFILALEAIPVTRASLGFLLDIGDTLIIGIFVIELGSRIIVTRAKFFKNYWNVFDLAVVMISLMPADFALSSLRVLRVLHSMQLLELIPASKHILDGFVRAIPGMIKVFFLGFVFIFAFGLMATHLYGAILPGYFGHIGKSMFTLFTMLTGGRWVDIVNKMPENHHAWVFFTSYAMIVGMCIYNMVIGAIVATIPRVHRPLSHTASRHSTLSGSGHSSLSLDIHEVELLQHQLAALQQQLNRLTAEKTDLQGSVN